MFGTDGVRGTPGQPPLDANTIAKIGAAAARILSKSDLKLLIVRDTRESGTWIEEQLVRGITHEGVSVVSAGVLPTPAAAFLSASKNFCGALVVSASHNPFPDNGIKVFTGKGRKASKLLESELEAMVSDESWDFSVSENICVETCDLSDSYERHLDILLSDSGKIPEMQIAVDCANGAMSEIAPRILRKQGFSVVEINSHPDGININSACGSTDTLALQQVVKEQECCLGIAFDGDGDRSILVDHNGVVVDGDVMLFICASYLKAINQLSGSGVVATVMSNAGLERALNRLGITLYRCPVGDREVSEAMLHHGLVLGGEQSGHLIFSRLLGSGDGLLTALMVIKAMIQGDSNLAELRQGLEIYPQVLVNVPVREKPDLASTPEISELIDEAEKLLGVNGRLLVRYSGTEPLLRVMIEGRDLDLIKKLSAAIASKARHLLG